MTNTPTVIQELKQRQQRTEGGSLAGQNVHLDVSMDAAECANGMLLREPSEIYSVDKEDLVSSA